MAYVHSSLSGELRNIDLFVDYVVLKCSTGQNLSTEEYYLYTFR